MFISGVSRFILKHCDTDIKNKIPQINNLQLFEIREKKTLKKNAESKICNFKKPWFLLALALLPFVSGLFFANGISADDQPRILILNSNLSVKKYFIMQSQFKKKFKNPTVDIDIGSKWQEEGWLEKTIRKQNPELIFCIGSKAYIQANKLAKDAKMIFSLGINWRRFPRTEKTYVISPESPPLTQLMMYRYFFPDIKKVGVLYSKDNLEWFNLAKSQGKEVGIAVTGTLVEKGQALKGPLMETLQTTDAFWLIPDPVLLSSTKQAEEIFKLAANMKKPVFAYDKVYARFGASFIVSADIPTMAGQAARMASKLLNQKKIRNKVQDPAGSNIAINLEKIEKYGIKVNPKAISSVNEIIE